MVRRLPRYQSKKTAWGFSVFRNCSIAMVSDVTRIGKFLITKLDREITKQPIRILKKRYTVLRTNPLGLKLCLSFIGTVRFDTRLICLKNHRPFRIVVPESVYDQIKLKRNSFCWIEHFITFPLIYSLRWLRFKWRGNPFFRPSTTAKVCRVLKTRFFELKNRVGPCNDSATITASRLKIFFHIILRCIKHVLTSNW